jgi:hypothetical protein
MAGRYVCGRCGSRYASSASLCNHRRDPRRCKGGHTIDEAAAQPLQHNEDSSDGGEHANDDALADHGPEGAHMGAGDAAYTGDAADVFGVDDRDADGQSDDGSIVDVQDWVDSDEEVHAAEGAELDDVGYVARGREAIHHEPIHVDDMEQPRPGSLEEMLADVYGAGWYEDPDEDDMGIVDDGCRDATGDFKELWENRHEKVFPDTSMLLGHAREA